ncbi:hypothetical protein DI005_21325 [Prauserella sp. PE36]|uniref:hypothetical protein n=1 Tax=Prauserella sp. PE36 TaxID=1504709 RepID=UPI000DE3BF06|nr:hypothetical protein [Prauserella sp. PE36]RBM17630.1 hypothetical protein DI005_21325 [Prauserella sp. PE36]
MALARRLGLANTTFRRHFPPPLSDIAAELTRQRSTGHATDTVQQAVGISRFEQLRRDNDRLRRANQELAALLDPGRCQHGQHPTPRTGQPAPREGLHAAGRMSTLAPAPGTR